VVDDTEIGGRTDYQCAFPQNARPQIEGKTVRAISILSLDRSPGLTDSGIGPRAGLTNFIASVWSAFFLPKGTPAAIVRRVNSSRARSRNGPQ
jgi:tripartite-type tricarboxylate transporter receptor subunit TctC